jgi:mono/diheme cytochrome c family protein
MEWIGSAIIIAVLLAMLVGLLYYASAGGRPATETGEVTGAPAMERKLVLTLAMLLGLFAFLTLYFLVEPMRLQAASESQEVVSMRRGVENYASLCYTCHGQDGRGATVPAEGPPRVAPPLNRPDLRPTDPDEQKRVQDLLFRTIARGRPNTPMPAWSRLEGGPLLEENIRELVLMIMNGEDPISMVEGGQQGGVFAPITPQKTRTAPVWEQVSHVVEEKIAHGSPTPIPLPERPAIPLSPEAERGLAYWRGEGACLGCHVIAGMGGGSTGPELSNIGNVAATRKPGMSAEDYIKESVLNPNAFVVQGFQPVMPPYQGRITDEQLNDLVQFYMSLKQ